MLRFQRRSLDYQELQKAQRWEYLPAPDAASFPVGLLSLGVLGSSVAQKLRALGFPVRGWSRTFKEIEGIECFHGREQLKLFLSQCRVLVCLLPLTSETEGILNHETFSALPEGAYLVNVALRLLHGRAAFIPSSGARHLKLGFVGWHYFDGQRNFKQSKHLGPV